MSPKTVWEVLEATVAGQGGSPAMREKVEGAWRSTTWTEYRDEARRVARALIGLGVEVGRGASILGFNCPRWFLADVGAIAAGAWPAGIYTTSSPEQCQYVAEHSRSQVVFVEDPEALERFAPVREQLPDVLAYVLFRGEAEGALSWDAFLARGSEVGDDVLDARLAAQGPEDTCTLIYTSGTTGKPKAVEITHDNVVRTARAVVEAVQATPSDQLLSYLPLSHIAEQAVSLHGVMAMGGCAWFAQSMETLGDDLREVRPTLFLGVPRVWEKIQAKMVAAGADAPWLRKQLVRWAKRVGLRAAEAEQAGRSKPLLYPLAKRLIFDRVRERLGLDRCRLQVSSAAPIARDTLEFFFSLGVPIHEVYGMSEATGPATISLPGRYRIGSAGFALPGTELQIADDGEVLMRGFHVFKGYLNNPEATAEAKDADGWLHSGDIGELRDGFLFITDRKKELLITAGGENVAPQPIEGQLKSISVVEQAVVVGDRRKYLSALLGLNAEALPGFAREAGSSATTPQEALACEAFRKHLQAHVDRVNAGLARVQTIKRWTILPRELTPEEGELTPTMKLKRRVINERYAEQIEGLYS